MPQFKTDDISIAAERTESDTMETVELGEWNRALNGGKVRGGTVNIAVGISGLALNVCY